MLAPENECALIRELTAIRKLLAVIARQRSKLLKLRCAQGELYLEI